MAVFDFKPNGFKKVIHPPPQIWQHSNKNLSQNILWFGVWEQFECIFLAQGLTGGGSPAVVYSFT